MKLLNRTTAKANQYPTKVIQFGEGNFLRAFVDWIIWNTNQKTDFNAGEIVDGRPVAEVDAAFVDFVLGVASGEHTNNEKSGYSEIAIFKSGVTL